MKREALKRPAGVAPAPGDVDWPAWLERQTVSPQGVDLALGPCPTAEATNLSARVPVASGGQAKDFAWRFPLYSEECPFPKNDVASRKGVICFEEDAVLPCRRIVPQALVRSAVALAALFLPAPTLIAAPSLAAPAGTPEVLLAEIRGTTLDPAHAVHVEGVELDAGPGRLLLVSGALIPSTEVGGSVEELVFLGRARLQIEPPDDIEAGQLELYTGGRRLNEAITEAVLVVGDDRAVAALLDRPVVEALDAETVRRARELFASWKDGATRRHLAVEASILLDALGEPGYDELFVGQLRSEKLGEFLFRIDPDEEEQVILGQFVPLEAEGKERRKLERELDRQRRRGRMIGLELEDLGEWQTWMSTVHGAPGHGPFEPSKYEIETSLKGHKLLLDGRCRVTLDPQSGERRSVPFTVRPDLTVTAARDSTGRDLVFVPSPGAVTVLLAEPAPLGQPVVVELDYEGNPTEKLDTKSFVLRDTLGWYPHTGLLDRATYDVTLHWPDQLDLVAPGRRLDGGKEGGMRWQRRVLEYPTLGYSFEIASFDRTTVQAGNVKVDLYIDFLSSPLVRSWRKEILQTITEALDYFQEIFGPYPLDHLTVVTSPRTYSQSLLGFMTLSSVMVGDLGFASSLLEDRRVVIAHELAHQWWGHRVGWAGYRDQWISEAMANYSALLFARNRLEKKPWRGPTSGWISALTSTTEDGRAIESLGPVVLGERLSSSRWPEAYEAIVYRKGAVVLDMIARLFGEERFTKILGAITRAADFRPISTETFLALVEKASGGAVDLDPFAREFIYSTGLPEVYYDYSFEKAHDGGWTVTGVARQQAPYRYTYRVVRRPGGGFDIAREAVLQMKMDDSRLVVPVRIVLEKADGGGRVTLQGHTLLQGRETRFHFAMPSEPVEVLFDPDHEVFGLFFNQRQRPKQTLYYRGLDLAAEGDLDGAEATYREALDAETYAGAARDEEADAGARETIARRLDVRILLRLSRLSLDRDHDQEAVEFLDRAERLLDRNDPAWIREDLKVLRARAALRRGDYQAAYDQVRHRAFHNDVEDPDGLAILAVAARQVGDEEEADRGYSAAQEAGVDLSALDERSAGPESE